MSVNYVRNTWKPEAALEAADEYVKIVLKSGKHLHRGAVCAIFAVSKISIPSGIIAASS